MADRKAGLAGERPPQTVIPPEAKKPRLTVKAESAATQSNGGSAHQAREPPRRAPSPDSAGDATYIANGHGMANQSEYAKNRPKRQVRLGACCQAGPHSCCIVPLYA